MQIRKESSSSMMLLPTSLVDHLESAAHDIYKEMLMLTSCLFHLVPLYWREGRHLNTNTIRMTGH